MRFVKKTDLAAVKQKAKTFLYLSVEETEFSPVVVQHPIFESGYFAIPTKEKTSEGIIPGILDIVHSPDDLAKARAFVKDKIESAETIMQVYLIIRAPYHLVFLKYIKDYITREDFSELLADAWTSTEDPNNDVNVTLSVATRWFRAADKAILMDPEELKVFESFQNDMKVYRGVALGRNPKGLSWTDNIDKAAWFAHRFDTDGRSGYIQTATVSRDRMLAYFLRRGEYELVVDTKGLDIEILQEGRRN